MEQVERKERPVSLGEKRRTGERHQDIIRKATCSLDWISHLESSLRVVGAGLQMKGKKNIIREDESPAHLSCFILYIDDLHFPVWATPVLLISTKLKIRQTDSPFSVTTHYYGNHHPSYTTCSTFQKVWEVEERAHPLRPQLVTESRHVWGPFRRATGFERTDRPITPTPGVQIREPTCTKPQSDFTLANYKPYSSLPWRDIIIFSF